jgi:hypothetical protein
MAPLVTSGSAVDGVTVLFDAAPASRTSTRVLQRPRASARGGCDHYAYNVLRLGQLHALPDLEASKGKYSAVYEVRQQPSLAAVAFAPLR